MPDRTDWRASPSYSSTNTTHACLAAAERSFQRLRQMASRRTAGMRRDINVLTEVRTRHDDNFL